MREGRSVYVVFIGRPERKRPLGRSRRRCEDNLKMDLFGWLRIGSSGDVL
jgi:hypothetical protein